MSLNKLLNDVKYPSVEFRGVPFWAWNGTIDEEEIRAQIRDFKKMGLGGFFMHSRVGLNIEYLGKKWFKCILSGIDEAKKLGLKAWLYDEDRWPSGAAGGLVTQDKKFRARQLKVFYGEIPNGTEYDDVLARFAKKKNHSFRQLQENEYPDDNEELLTFAVVMAANSSWYNDQTYLDTMNPEAVDRFIELTHETYAREIPQELKEVVPGIFTDEPNFFLLSGESVNSIPWSREFLQEFTSRHHYDIIPYLPELFFYLPESKFSKARMDYFDTATHLFVNSFSRHIGEWCEKHNMILTGHVLIEDWLSLQGHYVGSAMRFYEYMQAPGVDLLTEHWNNFNTIKQCVSVAHQFGRKKRLTELYGCTGWDFPFMGHKALGDWQFALGINFRCLHLAWYTMEGEAKRDYPATISYQSPWYEQYSQVEDYFGRLSVAMHEGEEVRDLLVIHPIESSWAIQPHEVWKEPTRSAMDLEFTTLTNRLLAQKLDFDFGEEDIMSRHGKVADKYLQIAKAKYKAVLIPKVLTLRATTLKLLSDFQQQGGLVVYLGNVPEYIDGVKSPLALENYHSFIPVTLDNMADILSLCVRRVAVRETNGNMIEPILYNFHESPQYCQLFLCNTGVNFSPRQMDMPMVRERILAWDCVYVEWKIPSELNVYELDLTTGKIHHAISRYDNGRRIITTSFPELGSRLFIASAEEPQNVEKAEENLNFNRQLLLPEKNWNFELDEENVLILDHPRWRINHDSWNPAVEILHLDDQLRKILGERPRGGAMVQPWLRPKLEPKEKLQLELAYDFNCQVIPPNDCFFAIENPDLYDIELNGQALDKRDCSWWVDRSMRKIRVPKGFMRVGRNKISLCCEYHAALAGLEYCYLLGEFGVKDDEIIQIPAKINVGDWTKQGFSHYSGNFTYSTTLPTGNYHEFELVIPQWRGVSLAISLNDSEFTPISWPPFKLRLSGSPGDTIRIRVYGHRRNSHGPFYTENKWPNWCGPAQFKTYETTCRQLVPCGLLDTPILKY